MMHSARRTRTDTPCHSAIRIHRSSFPPGYTLVELFLTLAVIMILLGMMINLSKRIRSESADKHTRQILSRLTVLLSQYRTTFGQLPPISPFIPAGRHPAEESLQTAAVANNQDLVRFLNLKSLTQKNRNSDDPLFSSLSQTEPRLLQDPWGSPIVFMPRQNPAIGMAPGDAFFLLSAGPDKLYLTREDNLYSYEENAAGNDRGNAE
jgi:type II secretory pathway pseudopilin PulG